MAIRVQREVVLEDVQRVLAEALGPAYRVTATSAGVRVSRNFVIWARVQVSWTGGGTTFRVVPGGFLLVIVVNALYTAPKVRHALERAFAGCS